MILIGISEDQRTTWFDDRCVQPGRCHHQSISRKVHTMRGVRSSLGPRANGRAARCLKITPWVRPNVKQSLTKGFPWRRCGVRSYWDCTFLVWFRYELTCACSFFRRPLAHQGEKDGGWWRGRTSCIPWRCILKKGRALAEERGINVLLLIR